MQQHRIAIALFLPLMTLGCTEAKEPPPLVPLVQSGEVTSVRCPEIDPRVRSELLRKTPRPAGPVSKDGVRAWIDDLESGEERKRAVGAQLMREYDVCRTGRQPQPAKVS